MLKYFNSIVFKLNKKYNKSFEDKLFELDTKENQQIISVDNVDIANKNSQNKQNKQQKQVDDQQLLDWLHAVLFQSKLYNKFMQYVNIEFKSILYPHQISRSNLIQNTQSSLNGFAYYSQLFSLLSQFKSFRRSLTQLSQISSPQLFLPKQHQSLTLSHLIQQSFKQNIISQQYNNLINHELQKINGLVFCKNNEGIYLKIKVKD